MQGKLAKLLKTLTPTQGNVPTIVIWSAIVSRFLPAVWGQIIVGEPLGETGQDNPLGGV